MNIQAMQTFMAIFHTGCKNFYFPGLHLVFTRRTFTQTCTQVFSIAVSLKGIHPIQKEFFYFIYCRPHDKRANLKIAITGNRKLGLILKIVFLQSVFF